MKQARLSTFEESHDHDLPDSLTEQEREDYRAVEIDGVGVRERARERDVSPGTLSNILRRAREKVEDNASDQ